MKEHAFAIGPVVCLLASTCAGSALAQVPTGPLAARSAVVMQARSSAAAIPEPLGVEEAVQAGLARNPQIAAAEAAVASAAANYRSLAAFPAVQLGVSRVQGTSSAPSLTGNTSDTILDVGDTLDTSGQRRYQAAGANAQLRVTRHQLEETRLTLSQQIRDAYWGLVVARAQTQIAAESLRDVQKVNELTHTQLAAGAAPRADVVRSGIDLANAQQAYVTAQGAERTALSAFNVLLARGPYEPIRLADNLAETTAVPTILANLPTVDALTRAALANRPLVKQFREQVRVADYAVKQARAAQFPDVSVDYERSVEQPVESVLLTARFPLLDLGSVRESIKAAQQSKKQAEAQLQQTEQQVALQAGQGHSDFVQAQRLAASYQADILLPSVTLLGMAQLGYKQGATGILPVLDAETTLRNARNGYVAALLALYKARDEIFAAVGGSF